MMNASNKTESGQLAGRCVAAGRGEVETTAGQSARIDRLLTKATRRGEEISIPTLALTREQAATALSLSPATVDRLTKRGLLKPSRATRRPLYSVEEIRRFLRETTAEIPAEETR